MSEYVDLGSFLGSNSTSSTIKSSVSPPRSESNACNTGAKEVKIPTLHQLCIRLISSKVERFPPEVFAAISESDWDEIVKHRHDSTKPKISKHMKNNKSAQQQSGGIDGFGRMCPAISDKVVAEIEESVPHLAESKVADILIWKDCVEYKFKPLGPTRPKALLYPWTTLVEKLKRVSNSLAALVEREDNSEQNKKSIQEAITVLMDAPMSVDLLNETKVGKIISKCIKRLSKREYQEASIWSEPIVLILQSKTSELLVPEMHLKNILQAWKDLASNSGVKIIKSPSVSTSARDCSGRNKQTSKVQHDMDMSVLKMCRSWRDLFQALSERKEHMLESHGAKMREKRQNMETTKHRVKKVGLKTSKPRFRSGNSIRAGGSVMLKRTCVSASSESSSSSKINSWKQQVAVSKAGQLGRPVTKTKVSAFSAAVANATRPAKRKSNVVAFGRKKEIELGNGKRMRLPNRDRDNKFQSNQLRNRLKNKAFGRF